MSEEQIESNAPICVELALYGSIARYGGGRHISQRNVTMRRGSTLQDLFERFEIPSDERGYVFRNAILHDMPGLNVAGCERLQDGDHVGIFSVDRTWPFQYRQGAPLSPALAKALKERGDMRHTYREEGARGK